MKPKSTKPTTPRPRKFPKGEIERRRDELERVKAALAASEQQREELRVLLRDAWEKGFALCRGYGDNHAHFDGDQKESQWKRYLESESVSKALSTQPVQAWVKKSELDAVKQELAAIDAGLTHEFSKGRSSDVVDDFAGFLEHHQKVEAELTAAKLDGERLDWCDRNLMPDLSQVGNDSGWNIRAAIDSAMTKEAR